jgi:hypothetical protein
VGTEPVGTDGKFPAFRDLLWNCPAFPRLSRGAQDAGDGGGEAA